MQYLGMKLKSLRQEKELTQRQLANILELTPAAISAYETGGNYPSADVIIKICKFFNISSDFLLGLGDRKDFNITDLTDEQYRTIISLITQFRNLNNLVSSD